jgi:VWFA-related protein
VRRGLLGSCLILIASIAAGQEPVFRSSNDTVRVFVTVTAADGRLVTTLGKSDFAVRDEGTGRPITLFDSTPVPIRLVMLLDVSSSMTRNLPLMRTGADHLLTRLRGDDLATVGTFGGDRIEIGASFTNDRASLRLALPREIRIGGTPLWRGIDTAMDVFGPAREDERRVILVLSDGRDADHMGGDQVTERDVRNRARRDGVMIYCIGIQGIDTFGLIRGAFESRPYDGLGSLAAETGGGYMEIGTGQNLVDAFSRVGEELHAQYLLGFEPSKRDGKVHRIEVRVAQQGMTARGRRNYVAPKQ